jgi:dihydrofolate reductase
MKQYVLSRTMEKSPDPNVELVSENIMKLVRELRNGEGKDIYLCGGGELATAFLAEGLIDEIILKVNPVLFGTGVPLFSETIQQTGLELISSKTYDNGVLLLQYRVKK